MCSAAIAPAQHGPSSHSEGCGSGRRVSNPHPPSTCLLASLSFSQICLVWKRERWGGGAELLGVEEGESTEGREVGSAVEVNAGRKRRRRDLFAWCFRRCLVK